MTAKHRSAMQPGRQYGQYRIIESLGSGGMGDVYAAEDTQLGRRVALKVLPEKMAANPERLRRFEREARVIASLNHPNIVTLHSIERDGETRFLTMELVSGSTLDTLIAPRGLQLGKFFELAIPLVEAVAAAHERGITHRDLKPGNIMVTDDSTVKVLDFGLAKLREPLLAQADSDQLQTELITGSGQIIGTVAYMSPEQAEGKPVDGRSDIFSLGVLFYEMLCGERPFQGDSAVSILSAILHVHPEPITSLRGSLPRQCGRIVEMCLQKGPSRRFQSAVDLRNALEALAAEVTGATSAGTLPAAGAAAPRRALPGLLIAAVGLGAALIGAWVGSQLTGSAVSSELAPVMSRSGWELGPFSRQGDLSDHPTWSPAGDWIAYASDAGGTLDIWKRPAAGGRPIRLTDDDTNELHPAWSPDGRMIAYAVPGAAGGIYLVDAEGGSPFRLIGPGTHPAWSPNGQRLAFDRHGAVVLIDANGRNERELLANTSDTTVPAWAPSGEALYVWHRLVGDVQLVSLDGREPVSLRLVPPGEEVTGLTYATASDELLLSRGQFGGHKNLWLAPIDPATGLTAGAATRITDPFTDDGHAAVGPDGAQIAFGARRLERHLWSFPLDPDTGLVSAEPTQLTKAAPQNYYPDLSADGRQLVWTAHQTEQGFLFSRALDGSNDQKITNEWGKSSREVGASFAPDGQRLSFASTQSGSYQIWQIPCLGCVPLPLTSTEVPTRDSLTAWSPDGSTIAFYSNRLDNWNIWTVDVERGGEPTQVTRLPGNEIYPVWSPDGRSIAFRSQQKDGNVDLWIVEPGGTPRPWIEEPGEEAWGAWSVVGTRFYYATNRNGSFNIWMRPHEGDTPVPVTAYDSPIRGLPDAALYTKFAVGTDRLIVPVETRSGEIWILERPR